MACSTNKALFAELLRNRSAATITRSTSTAYQDRVFSIVAREFRENRCRDNGKGLEHLDCWKDFRKRSAPELEELLLGGEISKGSQGVLMLMGPVETQQVGVLVTAYHLRHTLKWRGAIEVWRIEGEGDAQLKPQYEALARSLQLSLHVLRSFNTLTLTNSKSVSTLAKNLMLNGDENKPPEPNPAGCLKWVQVPTPLAKLVIERLTMGSLMSDGVLQTADCDPNGEVEEDSEKGCDEVVESGNSGYCECNISSNPLLPLEGVLLVV